MFISTHQINVSVHVFICELYMGMLVLHSIASCLTRWKNDLSLYDICMLNLCYMNSQKNLLFTTNVLEQLFAIRCDIQCLH